MLNLEQGFLLSRLISKCLLGTICLAFCLSAHAAATWNAVNNFSTVNNPNGVWSYLYDGGAQLPISQTGATAAAAGSPGLNLWTDGLTYPDWAAIGQGATQGTWISKDGNVYLPTTDLLLDPQTNSEVDVRFTAPSTGAYLIAGDFLGVNLFENSHTVQITDDGVIIFNGTISTYNQSDPFNFNLTLKAGDNLDFVSLTSGTGTYLGTGLAAAVTETPEPGDFGICALGFASLFLIRSRNRNSALRRNM